MSSDDVQMAQELLQQHREGVQRAQQRRRGRRGTPWAGHPVGVIGDGGGSPPMKAVLLGNAFLDFFVFALGWSGTISPIGIPAAVGGKPFFSEVLTPAVTNLLTGPNSGVPATAGAFAVRTFAAMVLFHGLVRLNAWAHFRERGARTAAVWSYLCELAFYALEIFAWGSQPLFVNNALAMLFCAAMAAGLAFGCDDVGGDGDAGAAERPKRA